MAVRDTTTTTPATDDDGWEDVITEAKIEMDKDGDVFIGVFTGWSETDSGIPQAHFESDALGASFINCGWSLKMQLKEVKKGTLVKLTRVGTQDTGQPSPMVLFKVQTKKR